MKIQELKTRHPAKFAEWERANKDLDAARDQIRPLNLESGKLWLAVEKAQAAYAAKREAAAALERRLRVPDLSRKLADLAREIKGM